jgi:hypothetical protein
MLQNHFPALALAVIGFPEASLGILGGGSLLLLSVLDLTFTILE